MPRRFTLSEAQSLLPMIGSLIREAVAGKRQYEEADAALQAVIQKVMTAGGMVVDQEAVRALRRQREAGGSALQRAVEQIQEAGCLVKDLDTGLVDFPTLFRGTEVHLCWRMDEPGISHWHGTDEGFSGRKPIDRDFLDHHEGDPTN